ncbi:MAG: cupin domain-containing protein [Methylophilus sp.]|nr:cupin domain-containing protein [Methylophilus sp.]
MHTLNNTPLTLLNQLTPTEFLAKYWQKKPLLIKQAIPDFNGLMNPNELAGLACEEEVQSRIVQYKKGKWLLKNGPFDENDFTKLPEKDWTLLVQSVNHHMPEANELLSQFSFIPHARLDDLMVSYAPDGGGVGPHFDSYDVFLLQGSGKRHWKITQHADHALIEGAPLKILKNFTTEEDWVLEPGDMLYLPPQVAHWGTAVGDDCMTYSIGFRAPKAQELAHEFLNYLQDNITLDGLYEDPDLTLQQHPAEISSDMVKKVSAFLKKIDWNAQLVGRFLGQYLSEPKPHIMFEPNKKTSLDQFTQRLQQQAIHLNLASQMLFFQNEFFLNGEPIVVDDTLKDCLQSLADRRYIESDKLGKNTVSQLAKCLHPHFLAGYLIFEDE